ncbi:MAG TPA: OmpA family protein [Steroidobacteraceae bacterium]|nr:OmpA family protein [Steroidobacteraceae bacterium]
MNTKFLTGIGIALMIAGCASTPKYNEALESARSTVQAAQADPNAAKYAAVDLQTAKSDLAVADAAFLRHDEPSIAQPAYMAAQNARLAQLRGAAKADDARVAAGQAERDSIVLAARTNQVDSANRAKDAANRATDDAKISRDQATENAARLQAEVDALKAKPTDRGLVLTLGDVLFETGSATLSSGAGRNLDRLVQFLTDHPERLVQIDGFTDSIGTDSFNQDLSQHRADAVRYQLVSRGISSTRIATQGYGKAFPVASNSESSGRQLNRRVEVVIGSDNGTAVGARRS